MGRQATMEDVAARAGVSRALVSIVYRNAPGASEATRARVFAAAAELGYRPDSRARLLGRQRTKLLGVVFGVGQSFHGDLVEALYAAAEAAGYDIALSGVAPSRSESKAAQSLLDYRCEALVLLGPTLKPADLASLASNLPVISVARKVKADGVDVVRTDDVNGARQAVDHLVALGHQHIAHVDGGAAPGAAERRTGYRNAIRKAGLTEHIIRGGLTEEHGAIAATELPSSTTAVTVFNDRAAVGLLDVVRRNGSRVPEDLSVVGYDDSTVARLSHISLTTIAQDTTALADRAVSTAIARLSDEASTTPPLEHVIPPLLVSRSTTGPPRA